MSNLSVRELHPPTDLCQFDANNGKTWYVKDPFGSISKKLLSHLADLKKTDAIIKGDNIGKV